MDHPFQFIIVTHINAGTLETMGKNQNGRLKKGGVNEKRDKTNPITTRRLYEEVKYIINELNEKYKYSQADIARILDINANTFNGWITGRVTCRHTKILVLAVRQVRILLYEAFN